MKTRAFFAACIAISLLFISGCEEIHYAMNYGVEKTTEEQVPIWPSPPEVPRYRYAGQLTGIDNFHIIDGQNKQMAEQVAGFLIGFDPMEEMRRRMPDGLRRPTAGMEDAMGRILVTDMGHQGIVVFDSVAGKLQIWDKVAPFQNFAAPVAITQGKNGEYLVSDADLGIIVRLDPQGKPIATMGHGILTRPTGIARDAAKGRIYVADSRAHDVKVLNDNGELIEVIGVPGDAPGQFNTPSHLSFQQDLLIVADTMNARVQIFDALGRLKRIIGQRGVQIGNLVRPKGVTQDSEGNIYVVESFHDHFLVFDAAGNFLLPIGGTGKEVGEFYLPNGMWSNNKDRIFVADQFNGRVVIFQFLGGS